VLGRNERSQSRLLDGLIRIYRLAVRPPALRSVINCSETANTSALQMLKTVGRYYSDSGLLLSHAVEQRL